MRSSKARQSAVLFKEGNVRAKLKLWGSGDDQAGEAATGTKQDLQTPTPAESALVGKVLSNKYQVLSFIGRGGMSVVFKAKDLLLDKDVALKVLRSHLLTDAESVERFKIEARAVSSLNSKHIIRLFDFDVTDDMQPFIVVELLIGPTLADVVEQSPEGTPPDEAISWFCQIASALQDAHDQGVIHRDLKPANVAIDGQNAKIFDFGIAKVLYGGGKQAKLTQTGDVFGSPMYMSPEQARGEKLDHRSDIYSFGCLMYEVLTGCPPIEADNIFDMLRKQMTEEPIELSKMAPAVSESLNYVVMRCLSKSPSVRYQSARHLLTDLIHVKEHRKIPKTELKKVSNYDSAKAIRLHQQRERASFEGVRNALTVAVFVALLGFCCAAAVAWLTTQMQNPSDNVSQTRQLQAAKDEYYKLKMLALDLYQANQYEQAIPLLRMCLANLCAKEPEANKPHDQKGEFGTEIEVSAHCLGKSLEQLRRFDAAYKIYKDYNLANDLKYFEEMSANNPAYLSATASWSNNAKLENTVDLQTRRNMEAKDEYYKLKRSALNLYQLNRYEQAIPLFRQCLASPCAKEAEANRPHEQQGEFGTELEVSAHCLGKCLERLGQLKEAYKVYKDYNLENDCKDFEEIHGNNPAS